MGARGFQFGFSKISPAVSDVESRQLKARKILAVLRDHLGHDSTEAVCLEVGSSLGHISGVIAPAVRTFAGIDIDRPALEEAQQAYSQVGCRFALADACHMPFVAESFDVVVCNQVYEHVPDARLLMREIHRVLKSEGCCYFGATNRLAVMERHYRLPFLSWLPRPLANLYMRWAGRGDHYYEHHYTLLGLKTLTKDFCVHDYTLEVLKDPVKYSATDLVSAGSPATRAPRWFYRLLFFMLPAYIWVLSKRQKG